jgi:hypothetical protein
VSEDPGIGSSPNASPAAVTATARTSRIDLAQETSRESFANFNPAKGLERQRWYMLIVVGGLFLALNAAVIWLIYRATNADNAFISLRPELADRRVITSAVFQTLIGATVVQTGAITWAMARFLFPKSAE